MSFTVSRKNVYTFRLSKKPHTNFRANKVSFPDLGDECHELQSCQLGGWFILRLNTNFEHSAKNRSLKYAECAYSYFPRNSRKYLGGQMFG